MGEEYFMAQEYVIGRDLMRLSTRCIEKTNFCLDPRIVYYVAYETLQEFLAPVAPGDVLDTIDTLQEETSKGTSVVAFVVGAAGATWAASGAMNAVIKAVNRAYERQETRPFWKVRLFAIVLVGGVLFRGLLFGGVRAGAGVRLRAGVGGR